MLASLLNRARVAWRAHPWMSVLVAIALLGVLKGSYTLFADLSRQLAAPLWGDSKLYMAAGRAMLNGIDPYLELFESKPPFMFWLAALSLIATGTQTLANVAQVIALLVIAATPGAIAWRMTRETDRPERTVWRLLGILGGIAFATYASARSGYIQTESFGTAAACLYIVTILFPERMTWPRVALAAFWLFCATWLKEPFVVVLGACALVLIRSPRDLVRTIIIPGIVVAACSVVCLWMTGYLEGYVTVYLPALSGHHVYGLGSPWSRMWNVHRPFIDLWQFSPPLLLAVIACCAGAVVRPLRAGKAEAALAVAVAACAILIMSFVAGLAGQYYGHHFIFALPVLIAIFCRWLRDGRKSERSMVIAGAATVCFAAGLLWMTTQTPLWIKPFWHAPEERAFRATAARFDALMDACGYDRYMAYGWELEDLWVHTAHTPYASTFSTFKWYLSHQHPTFAAMYVDDLNATPLIVIFEERMPQIQEDTQSNLFSVFTRDIPSCAAPYVPLKDGQGNAYTLLFRKSPVL